MDTVGEVLEAAADLLRTGGVIQGSFESAHGHCALGAIARVLNPGVDRGKLQMLARSPQTALHEAAVSHIIDQIRRSGWVANFGVRLHSDLDLIPLFNDRVPAEQVLQVFYQAAAAVQDQEFDETPVTAPAEPEMVAA